MIYIWKRADKLGNRAEKRNFDLKSFNNLKRAEEMRNPAEIKRIKYVETARKYIFNLDIKFNEHKKGIT